MESNLLIFKGPKNSGKTLKAKEMALDYKQNELIFVSEPLYEVDKILIYFNKFINKNTKLVVIDDISNIFFLFNIMLLYKYKKAFFKARNINIILICDNNIEERKVVELSVNHNIDCKFLTFPQ